MTMTHSIVLNPTPLSPSNDLYRSRLYSSTHKLGSFAGRSVRYLGRKTTKQRAVKTYVVLEAVITIISAVSLIMHQVYLPAILLIAMFAYLLYAALGAF